MSGPSPGVLRVYSFSVQEATHLEHDHVGPGHLLLGLLCLEAGDAYRVLAELGVELDRARHFLNEIIPSSDFGAHGGTPFDEAARRTLERASELRHFLEAERVTPEHLLLALTSIASPATQLLERFELTPGEIEVRLEALAESPELPAPGLAPGQSPAGDAPPAEWLAGSFGVRRAFVSTDVEAALEAAHQQARYEQDGNATVQPAHLLLGLLQEEIGITRRAFRHHGLYRSDVRAWMARQERAEPVDPDDPVVSTEVEAVISVAMAMVPDRDTRIDTGHVLLSMSYDPDGASYQLLADLTGDIDSFRDTVVRLMPGGHDGPAAVGVPV